jgi:hypothetical protein
MYYVVHDGYILRMLKKYFCVYSKPHLLWFLFLQKETIILTKILTEKPRTKKNHIIVLPGPSAVFIEQHAPPSKPSTTPPLKAWIGRSPMRPGS